MKRIRVLLLCLAAAALLCLLPNNAQAATCAQEAATDNTIKESGSFGTNVTWTLTTDGTLAFSGTGPMRDCYSYYSLPWYGDGVKTVVIEEGITTIGYGAFYYCSSLTQVSIPDSVTSIGEYAFRECSKLTEVTLSGNVTEIGEGAFQRSGIKQITIPNGIKKIDVSTFSGCYSLESVTIPASVTYIDSQAFYYCTKLTEVALPSSLTGIGSSAFRGCSSLTRLAVHGKVTSIGTAAFSDCTALTGISIYGQLTTIEKDTFKNCSSLVSIYIPNTVTSIGPYAFYSCTSLPKLTIPNGVTAIGEYAFYGCNSLPELTIPDSVTTIGQYAFYGCTGLEQITFGKGLSSIGNLGFFNCSKLTALTLPDSLTYIGQRCFEICSGLETVSFGTGLKQIDEDAFCNCNALKGVYIKDLAAWCGVQFGSTNYYGYKTSPLDHTPNLYLNGELIRSLVLPSGLTSVSANAFRNCTNIVNLTIPQSVTTIGEDAFYNCTNLTHVLHIGSRESYVGIVADTGLPGVYTWCRDAAGDEIYTRNACVTKEHICSICEKSLWSEPWPAGSHSWTAATCTTPKTCSACGTTEGDALGHSGGVWFELTAPTCTETGMKARICDVCNETEVVTLAALGHSYSDQITDATCTESGFTTHTCSVCGDTYTDTPVAALGHSFGDWTQTLAPTCTQEGKEQRVCATCGTTEEQDVAALGHTNTSVVTQPTCTVDGYTTNTCSVCGTVTTTDIVAAKGHSWSAWIQTAAPSCTKEGTRIRFCNCGVRETEVLPKSHSLQNGICTACGVLESYNWVLSADANVTLELQQDLYVDLNGFDLTGTMKCNGFKVYGLDSTTNSYTCQSVGYFKCTDEGGEAVVPQNHFKDAETLRRYMTVEDENGYSFHRFYLGITHISLKPTTVGVGYKAVFYGDEMVAANLDSFGFTMCLEGNDPICASKAGESFVSGKTVTLRVDNFNVERYGETKLYASVMLKLKDGTVIESASCQMTMRSLVETLNANYTALTAEQIAAVAELIKKYGIIQTWKVENLFTA